MDERQMARDLLRLLSMAATPMRVIHRCPNELFVGLQGLLSLSAKRHRRYWAKIDALEQEEDQQSRPGVEERDVPRADSPSS